MESHQDMPFFKITTITLEPTPSIANIPSVSNESCFPFIARLPQLHESARLLHLHSTYHPTGEQPQQSLPRRSLPPGTRRLRCSKGTFPAATTSDWLAEAQKAGMG